MTSISYANMSERLIEAVPELRLKYESQLNWWGDEKPGRHIVYGDLLNPYLISLLEENGQKDVLGRIFALLEALSQHEDILVREVVAVTVLETLVGHRDIWEKARKLMGKETLRIAEAVEIHWAEGKPLQI